MNTDHNFRAGAYDAQKVLEILGSPVRECLPDQKEPCGIGYEDHFAAYMVKLSAIAAHQIEHTATNRDALAVLYHESMAMLQSDPLCQFNQFNH
jgi:hypothetical protein